MKGPQHLIVGLVCGLFIGFALPFAIPIPTTDCPVESIYLRGLRDGITRMRLFDSNSLTGAWTDEQQDSACAVMAAIFNDSLWQDVLSDSLPEVTP